MRGVGFEFDVATGTTRSWYAGKDGVRRWASDGSPVVSLPPIVPPNPPQQPQEGDPCAERP